MGKFILVFLLSFYFILFLGCSDKKNSQGCNPFCEGDQWYVKEFYADPYPSMIPFEENEFLSALEKDIIFWKRDGDTLTLVGNDKKEVAFGYKGGTDTLTISAKGGQFYQILLRSKSDNQLHLELIGLYHANIYLEKQD
jgi:hypothetical protein